MYICYVCYQVWLYFIDWQIFCLWTGLDVEMRLNFEWTPLMCAVNVADYNLAELLLERGANASFHKGQKPLWTDW